MAPSYNHLVPALHLPEPLRRYAGGEAVLPVSGATVGAALEDAFSRHPDLRARVVDEAGRVHPHLAVFLGREQLRREEAADAPLGPGEALTLLVAVDGG